FIIYWWDGLSIDFLLLASGIIFLYYLMNEFERYLNGKKLSFVRMSGISLLSVPVFSMNIPGNISFVTLTVLLPLSLLFSKKVSTAKLIKTAYFYFTLTPLLIVFNFWWLGPSAMFALLVHSFAGSSFAVSNNKGMFINYSRVLSFITLYRGLYGVYLPYKLTGLNSAVYYMVGNVATYIIPATITLSLIFKGKYLRIFVYFFISTFLVSLFFLGFNSPIYGLVLDPLLQNAVVLQGLRLTYYSFSIAFYILLIILDAIAITRIATAFEQLHGFTKDPRRLFLHARYMKSGKSLHKIAIVLIVSILLFFPFTSISTPIYTGYGIPHSPYRARMIVPNYEYSLASYLNRNLNGSYALIFPGGFLEQNWSHGYDAFDILPSLLPSSLLIDGATNPTLAFVYSVISSGEAASQNLGNALPQLNIKYIVIEGDVGGPYPFPYSTAPNYPLILNSLNHTKGLVLDQIFGPDYIYKSELPQSMFSVASHIIPSRSLIDNYVVPVSNLTHNFYDTSAKNSPSYDAYLETILGNKTLLSEHSTSVTYQFFNYSLINTTYTPPHDFYPVWNNGIFVSLNNSSKEFITLHPLPEPLNSLDPVYLYNGLPLDINTSKNPYLIINFSTNINTGFKIFADTSPTISNASVFNQNLVLLGFPANSLGFGDAKLFNTYGGNTYSSPNESTTMLINLNQALASSQNKTIHYILFQILPASNTGTGLPYAPVNEWPGYQNISISYMALGNRSEERRVAFNNVIYCPTLRFIVD
ncbi:MAG: hypothetical protein M1113_05820, partial [Candidatus Thermoplasmatota archaeon]|nr:hypothetical protein [Candidatus Thermoplasmatota archaeon]